MRQWTIDAFASRPFRGNQACVVEPFDAWPEAAWMQALAAENNQAETAFLLRTGDADRFGLRWFTPALEVPLCGHATLASGHALMTELGFDGGTVCFDTHSGELRVRRAVSGYEMDLPADRPRRIDPPDGLAKALGAQPVEVWAAGYLIVVLDSAAAVRSLAPDIPALGAFPADRGRGNVGVTARADESGLDVVSRFFAPGSGIPEDPATGSLHAMLAPLWAEKLERSTIRFHQAYPGRGADMEGEMRGERVLLRGEAVTVMDSRLRLTGHSAAP